MLRIFNQGSLQTTMPVRLRTLESDGNLPWEV